MSIILEHVPGYASFSHPLPDQLIELIAKRFRVLGEPMHIKLLDCLRNRPATVRDLQQALGASQQNVSKHLGVLLDAGMVRRAKRGNHSVYATADPAVFELCEQVCTGPRHTGRHQIAISARPRQFRAIARHPLPARTP